MLQSFALLSLLAVRAWSLSMDVAAGAEQCVFFDVKLVADNGIPKEDIFGSFQVASGGFLDIDLKVKTPSGKVVYTAERKTTDRFTLVAQGDDGGEWSACFSNKMSTLTSKVVSFNFRTGAGFDGVFGDKEDSGDPKNIATKKAIGPVKQNILKLASELVDIREIQNYANVRERAHRDTTESTNDRVKWFSVCEFVILLITNVWQIYSLRQFFEKRSRI